MEYILRSSKKISQNAGGTKGEANGTVAGTGGTISGSNNGVISSLASAVTDKTITLEEIESGINDDTALNITWSYPNNILYEVLTLKLSVYEFINGSQLATDVPKSFSFNLTYSNTTVKNCAVSGFQPGRYVIACIQALQYYQGVVAAQTNQCGLGQTTVNGTSLPQLNLTTSFSNISANQIDLILFWPLQLPYDNVSMNATINGMIYSNYTTVSNQTYMITTYYFLNLSPNTEYNVCSSVNYSNNHVSDSVPGLMASSQNSCNKVKTTSNAMGGVGHLQVNSVLIFIFFIIVAVSSNTVFLMM
ncbi:unnamed protein product [Didymodactylos carnosus]|uniref:Uncharacterized protein n=1 Tax=Didymodactylos carnosus TaxID=1234261 RepID=A0A8S2EHL2_9BILA|nr:unnamed protein product [Didymodactylos carnosus]CAF3949823.1 unnamed protein product [Didymodactylos carnosus]